MCKTLAYILSTTKMDLCVCREKQRVIRVSFLHSHTRKTSAQHHKDIICVMTGTVDKILQDNVYCSNENSTRS
jgi:hypothetical protein